jgi:NADH-quinone oxidoreductase subunit G
MPTFKLDGREIPFEKGETVIQAAHRAGIDIPHYCWHPGLSIAANCRMCLVEVAPPPGRPAMLLNVLSYDEKTGQYVDQRKPKLQPACQLPVAEGMDVRSESSPHVEEARSAVQEFLLLNHPVDCPICDQAGECRLQDYWLEHQHKPKRMHDEPVHKPKAVVFGPTIVYDAERCIVCTRCVRFSDEVAKDPVLDVRERGNLNEIVVAPGRQLDHDYTLMTEYVCPVGALTASDFRFKARVWFLRSARTICQGCATGCNAFMDYDPRDNQVHRHRPRENLQVNKYWMCDAGMLDYRRVHENRVLHARVMGEPARVGDAIDRAADLLSSAELGKLGILLSAQHSNEDTFAALELGKQLGAGRLFMTGRPPGKGDDILRHPDKNPNTAGVVALAGGVEPDPLSALAAAIERGTITHVLALGADVAELQSVPALAKLRAMVALSTWEGPIASAAHVLLPASSWAESDGHFVNAKGMNQESQQAIAPRGDSRPAWKLLAAIALRLGFGAALPWRTVDDLWAVMSPKPAPVPKGRSLQPGAAQ